MAGISWGRLYKGTVTKRTVSCFWKLQILTSHVGPLVTCTADHDDVMKWKRFPCYWPFVWGIHQSLVNSPNEGQWHGALMFFFICAWTNGWVNTWFASDLRCHRTHYDVTVMHEDSPFYIWISQSHSCCQHSQSEAMSLIPLTDILPAS